MLRAETQPWSDLFTNGKTYHVSRFQRDYSWTEEEWDDLWFDVLNLDAEEGGVHYMGYAVLQTVQDKQFRVIDGQQRFATLSVLALAILKHLADLASKGIDRDETSNGWSCSRADSWDISLRAP